MDYILLNCWQSGGGAQNSPNTIANDISFPLHMEDTFAENTNVM